MTYCTLADVRRYGKFRDAETDDNALIEALIARVQARFERETGRVFASDTDTPVVIPTAMQDVERRRLYIRDDLCQVTSVAIGDTTLDSGDYELGSWGGSKLWKAGERIDVIRLLELSWSDDVTIVGRWAYSVTPPADVVHACIEWTFYEYKRATAITTDGAPVVTTDGQLVMSNTIPHGVRATIDAYKRGHIV